MKFSTLTPKLICFWYCVYSSLRLLDKLVHFPFSKPNPFLSCSLIFLNTFVSSSPSSPTWQNKQSLSNYHLIIIEHHHCHHHHIIIHMAQSTSCVPDIQCLERSASSVLLFTEVRGLRPPVTLRCGSWTTEVSNPHREVELAHLHRLHSTIPGIWALCPHTGPLMSVSPLPKHAHVYLPIDPHQYTGGFT